MSETIYTPLSESLPPSTGRYLCRLLDGRGQPYYQILTWFGVDVEGGDQGFYYGMAPMDNVTHWAPIPTLEE
jgi:hypothetical protein